MQLDEALHHGKAQPCAGFVRTTTRAPTAVEFAVIVARVGLAADRALDLERLLGIDDPRVKNARLLKDLLPGFQAETDDT